MKVVSAVTIHSLRHFSVTTGRFRDVCRGDSEGRGRSKGRMHRRKKVKWKFWIHWCYQVGQGLTALKSGGPWTRLQLRQDFSPGVTQGAFRKTSMLKIRQGFLNSTPRTWQAAKVQRQKMLLKATPMQPVFVRKFGLEWMVIGQDTVFNMGYKEKLRNHSHHAKSSYVVKHRNLHVAIRQKLQS